jgi:FKBP-type peptidyl-prolyl cis-trans isomerase 2
MEVGPGRVVTLEYTVRLASGKVLDSTGDCGPVAIMCGAGQLFPALEDRLDGMRVGETRELRIPASEAYGEWQADLVRELPRERLPPEIELTVGAEYRIKAADGKLVRFRLLAADERTVRADFNPPTAGEDLLATVTVVDVRAATPEEERRGRV